MNNIELEIHINTLNEKIEELRKDINFDTSVIHSRLQSQINHQDRINHEKDAEIKQLKEKINLLSKEISLIWDRLDKGGFKL